MGGRPVTLRTDLRKTPSSNWGFPGEHRDINIRRIGYVVSKLPRMAASQFAHQRSLLMRIPQTRSRLMNHRVIHLGPLATPLETRTARPVKALRQGARRSAEGVH
jgi:adenylylsulfate kinase-like enzyme